MKKCLFFLSLPLFASEAPDDASSSRISVNSIMPILPSVPTRPVPIRAMAQPRVDYPTYAPKDMEGRAPETAPIGTPPSSPQPARILRGKPTTPQEEPRRTRRSLIGFARGLPVEILVPGMLITFDSTTAVYRRGNKIEIRIHNNIDIDEDHSGDASE